MNRFLLLFSAFAALAIGVWFGLQQSKQLDDTIPEIDGFIYPQAKQINTIDLLDQNSEAFGVDQLKGKWSLLYFGYTYCPDICPLTLSELNKAMDLWQAKIANTESQVILVSVDPERDTPERLGQYVRYFNDSFIGVSGTLESLTNLTQQIAIVFAINKKNNSDQDYLVDHSSSIIVFDPDAKLHAILSAPHTPEQIAEDFTKIVQRWRNLQS